MATQLILVQPFLVRVQASQPIRNPRFGEGFVVFARMAVAGGCVGRVYNPGRKQPCLRVVVQVAPAIWDASHGGTSCVHSGAQPRTTASAYAYARRKARGESARVRVAPNAMCITVGSMSEREVIQQVSEADAPLSISQRLGRLQFHRSGKFRILQLADIQDGPKVSADTIHLIEAALASARPDLVVFSGNQIAGYDPAYAATFCKRHWKKPMSTPRREAELEQTRARVRESIRQFVTPMVNVGVPWAVTYGNHDFQCGLSNAQLDAVYHEFKGCLNPVVTPLIERSMHIGDGADRTQVIKGIVLLVAVAFDVYSKKGSSGFGFKKHSKKD